MPGLGGGMPFCELNDGAGELLLRTAVFSGSTSCVPFFLKILPKNCLVFPPCPSPLSSPAGFRARRSMLGLFASKLERPFASRCVEVGESGYVKDMTERGRGVRPVGLCPSSELELE